MDVGSFIHSTNLNWGLLDTPEQPTYQPWHSHSLIEGMEETVFQGASTKIGRLQGRDYFHFLLGPTARGQPWKITQIGDPSLLLMKLAFPGRALISTHKKQGFYTGSISLQSLLYLSKHKLSEKQIRETQKFSYSRWELIGLNWSHQVACWLSSFHITWGGGKGWTRISHQEVWSWPQLGHAYSWKQVPLALTSLAQECPFVWIRRYKG